MTTGLTTRVTHRSIGTRALQGLQGNLDRMGRLQQQLSSGKALTRPSDSPTGTGSALRFRSEIRTNEQWSRNADDGIGWLGRIDSTLQTAVESLHKANEVTLASMSSGSVSAASRQAYATEVDGIRSALLGLSNARYLDRPVFGGTTPGTAAYDASGTYVGDGNPVMRTVGDGTTVRVDAPGPEVFGSGDTQVFSVLADISAHLRTDPDKLAADLGRLQKATTGMQDALSTVGARYSRVEQMRQQADDRVLTLRGSLSEVEDVDLPKTIVEMQMQESAYQAALGATSKVVQPSLVEFLR